MSAPTAATAPDPADVVADRDGDPLLAALATLSDDDRDLLVMRAWDGLAVTDIAALLDATPERHLGAPQQGARPTCRCARPDRSGIAPDRYRAIPAPGRRRTVTDRDPLIEQLATLDPVRVDRAPAPGSTRHAEILERAMQSTPTLTDSGSSSAPRSTRPSHGRRRTGRRAVLVLGAAAAILAIVTGIVLLEPSRPLSPAAALSRAAENPADALTLRSEYIQADGNGGFNVVRSEHRGNDLRRKFIKVEPDGTERTKVEDEEFVVYIGNKGWTDTDGRDEATIVKPEERNAPYAESSAAIVDAAVTDSTVTEIGAEDVRGVEATHYRIKLDDAVIRRLGTLRPNQLSAFELENTSQIRSLDVWIADGYIRRIRVTHTPEAQSPGTTVEFYDFGADITIAPPS